MTRRSFMPFSKNPFTPLGLLPNGQIQTIVAHLIAHPPLLRDTAIETVSLSDGDRINLHLNHPKGTAKRHFMVLLHGLGGSCESDYILRITAKLNALGYPVIRFNHRGCGPGGAEIARSIYHAGRTADLEDALRHIKATWRDYKISLAAFSLSANMLLRYLGDYSESGIARSLERAIAVCPPINLEDCSLAISSRRNLHLDMYYTRRLVKAAREKKRLFPDIEDVRFPLTVNLRLFDEIYTARIGGFASRDDYYTRSSAHPVLPRINTDTAIIYAEDDPIIPPRAFHTAKFSNSTQIGGFKYGGHMGFVSAHPTKWGDRWWMDETVIDWLTT